MTRIAMLSKALCLKSAEKAVNYREKAMPEISTSQETLNVVKKALSKHANPVPCEICGELMKNIKGKDQGVKMTLFQLNFA
ncbi:hypothetical protein BpHYR1_005930 [Brachionus plicatilis]|uniref:Uncharacterized protein n=1 Tax=Brachionus plicatilis TaxID=10195 RepID=A0A3M7SG69_BRAPC|nr:hypothetical protein BpHYR1_005930 [Brachionus plicatilis]